MAHWEELLHRTDLSDEELKQIPARSNENSLAVWQYYSKKFGVTPEQVVEGAPYGFDEYTDSKNWEDAYHARITDRNILSRLQGVVVHREPYLAGRQFFQTKNTVLRTFMRLVPIEKMFKDAKNEKQRSTVEKAYGRFQRPLDGMFERLKRDLETLPTRAQRRAAAQSEAKQPPSDKSDRKDAAGKPPPK